MRAQNSGLDSESVQPMRSESYRKTLEVPHTGHVSQSLQSQGQRCLRSNMI